MSKKYPCIANPDRIPTLLVQVQKAGVPKKFTFRYLASLGFASSNDRSLLEMLRMLGFLNESGIPTSYYYQLRDTKTAKHVLGSCIKSLYGELFLVDTKIYEAPFSFVQNVFTNLVNASEKERVLITRTFIALCEFADFEEGLEPSYNGEEKREPTVVTQSSKGSVTYNININLPETTNTKVYEAILDVLDKFQA